MKKIIKIKTCMNCLREIKKCKCKTKLIEYVEECKSCGNGIDEFDKFCSQCGEKLYD